MYASDSLEAVECCAPLGAPTLSNDEAAATAELFKALSDPARVRILNVLSTSDEPVCVCHLVEPLGLSQPTVSHHLKKLLDAGLVQRELRGGETVLDLGSGGGIDVILSAKRVGPTGTVYGLDMTDEMLALARRNAAEAGVANVHFLKGVIEAVPLPAESVDVVISNCVINLSVDKPAVLMEIARVLKPGGRVGVSDVVAEDDLTPEQRAARGSYVGCIAGALSRREYTAGLEEAGFEDVTVEFTHEVAEGMHGAIVKGVKTRGLPVIQPAAQAGCC